jgi:hypothetical protein
VRPNRPEDRARAEELAREQERVREQILQLALRNEERENSPPLPALDRAGEKASEASGSLQQGKLRGAEEQEQEVERELENAIDELEKEEEQYQRLRQEELLFQITEESRQLLERHLEQMSATREIDAERVPGERPSRSQRLRLRKIGREEAAIGERTTEMSKAITEEGAVVVADLLDRIRQDLERVARDVDEAGDYQTGPSVQSLQRDVEEALGWLIASLEEEQQRRARPENQQQQQEQEQDQNRQQLVPDTAELKLLARMDLEVQRDIEELVVLYPELSESGPIDPLLLEEITRLAVRHERTSDLFAQFRERLGLPDPDGKSAAPTPQNGEGDETEDE